MPRRAERLKGNLGAFGCALSPSNYKYAAYHHEKIIPALERLESGNGKDRLAIFAPPQHLKPLHVDTPVLMADGAYRPLGQLRPGDRVINKFGKPTLVERVQAQGVLPLLRITTHSGRSILAERTHGFLTPSGFMQAGDLRVGWNLALLANAQCEPSAARIDAEYSLLGYFLGDGSIGISKGAHGDTYSATITNQTEELLAHIEQCAAECGFKTRRGRATTCPYIGVSDGVRKWLRDAGVAGMKSRTKRIPDWVFQSSPRQIALLLAAFFDCDGSVVKKGNQRKDCYAVMTLCQKPILDQQQHLYLRLGVPTRVRAHPSFYKGEPYDGWELGVGGQHAIWLFRQSVPLLSYKRARLDEWAPVPNLFHGSPVADRIVSIEEAAPGECACISVAEGESFIANDFIVHNSTWSTRYFIPWYLGRNPNHAAMTLCYGKKLSDDFGRYIREQCSNPTVLDVFPGLKPKHGSNAIDCIETVGGNKYYTAGFKGTIAGRHLNLLVIDDPVKDLAEARSDTIMETRMELYRSVVEGRMKPKGKIIMCLTRYCLNDFADRVLKYDGEENWDILVLAAENEDGSFLWEDYFGRAKYLRAKRDREVWFATWMQQPKLTHDTFFAQEWLQFYPQDMRVNRFNTYMVCDPALSTARGADRTSIIVVAAGPEKRLFVVDWVYDRLDPAQRADAVCRLVRKWKPKQFLYEETGLNADTFYLNERFKREGITLRAEGVGRKGPRAQLPKKERIRELISDFSSGRIWFPEKIMQKNANDGEIINVIQSFIDQEYLKYRGDFSTDHDDGLDCLSRLHDPEFHFVHAAAVSDEKIRRDERRGTWEAFI